MIWFAYSHFLYCVQDVQRKLTLVSEAAKLIWTWKEGLVCIQEMKSLIWDRGNPESLNRLNNLEEMMKDSYFRHDMAVIIRYIAKLKIEVGVESRSLLL